MGGLQEGWVGCGRPETLRQVLLTLGFTATAQCAQRGGAGCAAATPKQRSEPPPPPLLLLLWPHVSRAASCCALPCFTPAGVRSPMELSTYFRINASETGQVRPIFSVL